MVLRKLAITLILLATFVVTELARLQGKSGEAVDSADAHALQDRATGAEFHSADRPRDRDGPPARPGPAKRRKKTHDAQALQDARASLESRAPTAADVAPDDTSNDFSILLEYLKKATGWHRRVILMAVCESRAFTCEEIIQLVNFSSSRPWEDWGMAYARRWIFFARIFVEGRQNTGCIADPANAQSIVHAFEERWRYFPPMLFPLIPPATVVAVKQTFSVMVEETKQMFSDGEGLRPAENRWPPIVQLQRGLRADEEVEQLAADIREVLLIKFSSFSGYGLGNWILSNFVTWLKQIRSNGEQFSGPQLIRLAYAIPENMVEVATAEATSLLLQYLEQYVTGVTCKEVKQILERMVEPHGEPDLFAGLVALKPNIVDTQNKGAIIAATTFWENGNMRMYVAKTEKLLRDMGVGLPPKNNPVFGVVEGNPVIFLVDESTSMDAKLTVGNDTLTRRKFCHMQLETVLAGLPNNTHFNVVRYSVSVVKLFPQPVLVSKTNIDRAMEAVSWRGGYTPGQDPIEMLQEIRMFASEYKHRFHRSTKKRLMEALELAYGMEALTPQQAIGDQPFFHDPRDATQIYSVTSGQPEGGARPILDKIDELDGGRNIPVHSISWIMPDDPEAKQFVKDLASKTGGFFRPIEQAS